MKPIKIIEISTALISMVVQIILVVV